MTEGFAGMERFFGSSTGRGFRARYYASEFEARSGASGRKTTFNRPKWKRREQFFERGNYRFVWSPRSLALQEADRDIGHIPGVRKARREPNRDLHVFSPPLSPSFPSWPSLLSVLPFPLNISAAQGPPRTPLSLPGAIFNTRGIPHQRNR